MTVHERTSKFNPIPNSFAYGWPDRALERRVIESGTNMQACRWPRHIPNQPLSRLTTILESKTFVIELDISQN